MGGFRRKVMYQTIGGGGTGGLGAATPAATSIAGKKFKLKEQGKKKKTIRAKHQIQYSYDK